MYKLRSARIIYIFYLDTILKYYQKYCSKQELKVLTKRIKFIMKSPEIPLAGKKEDKTVNIFYDLLRCL